MVSPANRSAHSHSTHSFVRRMKKLFMAYAGITHFSRFSPSMTYSDLRTRKFQRVVTTAVVQTTSQAESKRIPKQKQAPAHKQWPCICQTSQACNWGWFSLPIELKINWIGYRIGSSCSFPGSFNEVLKNHAKLCAICFVQRWCMINLIVYTI